MKGELFGKYIWLVQTFIKAGDRGLDLDGIERKWEMRYGTPYPRRSFANHREAIEAIFGIRIECDRKTNRYFIRYASDLQDGDEAAAWLVNTFTVNNLLALGKERLSGRVSVENIPSGQRWLTELMDAMMDGNVVRLEYRKYSSEEGETLDVRPYALKESEKRWYLVGWCEQRRAMRVYGLDRILSMEVTGKRFAMPAGFDVDELFASSYGVYLSQGNPVTVEIKAPPREARYLRDLPLHPSQKENEPGIFRLRVEINEAFIMRMMSYGDKLEVIAPEALRAELASRHLAAAK